MPHTAAPRGRATHTTAAPSLWLRKQAQIPGAPQGHTRQEDSPRELSPRPTHLHVLCSCPPKPHPGSPPAPTNASWLCLLRAPCPGTPAPGTLDPRGQPSIGVNTMPALAPRGPQIHVEQGTCGPQHKGPQGPCLAGNPAPSLAPRQPGLCNQQSAQGGGLARGQRRTQFPQTLPTTHPEIIPAAGPGMAQPCLPPGASCTHSG